MNTTLSTLQRKTIAQAEALGLDVEVTAHFGVAVVQIASKGASEVWITSCETNNTRRTNTVIQYTFGQELPMRANDIPAELERFARI